MILSYAMSYNHPIADMTPEPKRPLKVFPSTSSGRRLCQAHADRDPVPQGDDMRGLPEGTRLTQNGVDRYAWLDKANLLQWLYN